MSKSLHFEGPYRYVRSGNHPDTFCIYAAGMPAARIDVPPIGIVPRNKRGRLAVEATARVLTAAPTMLAALQEIVRIGMIPDMKPEDARERRDELWRIALAAVRSFEDQPFAE